MARMYIFENSDRILYVSFLLYIFYVDRRSTFRTNLRVSTAKKLPTQLFNLTVVWTPPINLTKVYKYTLSIAQGSKVHQEHPPNTTNMFTIQNVHSSLSYSLDLYITYDGEDIKLDRIYYKINGEHACT